jgi:peptide/nickel transport system substrate-binding protein
VIVDPNTQQAAFRTGQVMELGTNGQITRLLKQTVPDLYVEHRKLFTNNGGNRLWVSAGRDLTKDIRVRQALSKVMDRQAFIDSVLFGSGWLSTQVFIPRTDWLLPEDETKRLLAKDVTAAKQLLSAAGVDLSTWRPIVDYGVPNAETTAAVELAIAHMRELGINGTANAADKVELTERIYQRGDFEMCVGNNTPTSPTNNHLTTFYHTKGAQTGTWKQLGDKQLDDLIDKQAAELNVEQRGAVLKEIQKRIIELAVAIPLYSSNGEVAVSPKLRNYKNASGIEVHRFAESYVNA